MNIIEPVKGTKCPKCGSTNIELWIREIGNNEVINIIIDCRKCEYRFRDEMICKACGGEVVDSIKGMLGMLDCKKCGKHWEEYIRD